MNAKFSLMSFFLLASLVHFAGCTSINNWQDEVALRGSVHTAYKREEVKPPYREASRHYERGWKQAYYDVSNGASGAPPALPPQQYWSAKYKSASGCKEIDAWFTGYRRGAQAAQCECRGDSVPLTTGHLGQFTPAACYPIPPLRSAPVASGEAPSTPSPIASVSFEPPVHGGDDYDYDSANYADAHLDAVDKTNLTRLPPVDPDGH